MSRTFYDPCMQFTIPDDFDYFDFRNYPTQSDLRRNMGEEMTKVYLETCSPIEKTLFGHDKPLSGPQEPMWINPDDRLGVDDNGVRLTPAPNVECLQALTHRRIMAIGAEYEKKLEAKQQQLVQQACAKNVDCIK